MHNRLLLGICLISIVQTSPGLAQPRPNIAGNYRGIMTGCVTASQPSACRKGLTELVRLAVEVDDKRAEWELVEHGNDNILANRKHGDYAAALDRLSRAVVEFNLDMKGAHVTTD